jgi:2'-5' RNA ligase
MDQTALIVPVPRIGPLLQPWRSRYDPSAAGGVPPHVTVLVPFLRPAELRAHHLAALEDVVAHHAEIDVELATVGMFDEGVLHMRPEPDTPFRELTADVHDRFPDSQPYGGRHDEVVPHVTVGHDIPRPAASHAARSLMLALPIRVHLDVVQLWAPRGDQWTIVASFPLGTALVHAA